MLICSLVPDRNSYFTNMNYYLVHCSVCSSSDSESMEYCPEEKLLQFRVREAFQVNLKQQIKDKHWKDVLHSALPKWPRRETVPIFCTTKGQNCLGSYLHRLSFYLSHKIPK